MTEKEQITLDKFGKFVTDNNPTNEFLVKLFELTGVFFEYTNYP